MIDLQELTEKIRTMTRQQPIYRVLRDELIKRGYWRKRARGNPSKGYRVMKAKQKRG